MPKYLFSLSLTCFFFLQISCVSQRAHFSKNNLSQETLYIGTYTNKDVLAHLPNSKDPGKGIYSFSFNQVGQLKPLAVTPVLNPAVLILHPERNLLYAITERIDQNGSVETFSIGKKGQLVHHSSFEASGKSTCYLTIDNARKNAILVNYWDAFIDVVRLDEKGYLKSHKQNFRHQYDLKSRQVLTRDDHWNNRMAGPHAHSAHFWKNRVFIPDLGKNVIVQYQYSDEGFLEKEAIINLEAGSGPRHMVINKKLNVAYVSNELKSSVVIAKLDDSELSKEKPRFNPIQYVSTIPKDYSEKNYVSEVQMSKDEKFLYVSNRGHDSIAIYKINQKSGKLTLLDIVLTEGKFPRHFALSPRGNFLLVANQDSNSVNVFHRDLESGLLRRSTESIMVPTPNYIRFLGKDI